MRDKQWEEAFDRYEKQIADKDEVINKIKVIKQKLEDE